MTRAERAIAATLYVLLAIAVLATTHKFFAYIGHYPYWSIDDGLSVVSTSWLQTGHYGDPSVPVEGFSDRQRFRGFFIYGPWPFAAGSLVTWLLGFSVEALRAVHLFAALSLVLVASRLFTGLRGAAALTLLAAGIGYTVVQIQWPMVRPDVFVTAFAGALIWATAAAIERRQSWYWFLAGLAAGCGALSHLIGGSLLPASLLAMVAGVAIHQPLSAKAWLGPALSVVAGWLASAAMFYASFGFRFSDHFTHLLKYRSSVTASAATALNSTGPIAVWQEHFRIATSGVAGIYVATVAVAFLVAVALSIRALWRRGDDTVEVVTVLLPASTIFGLYALTLAFYPNFHTGYVILPQLLGLWLVAGVAYVLLGSAARRFAGAGRFAVMAAALVVAVVVARSSYGLAAQAADDPRLALTRSWIAISEYVDEVLGPLPMRAIAWGAAPFAAEGPERIQLISMETALFLMEKVPSPRRAALAPDYLVWGHPQSQDVLANPFVAPDQLPLDQLRSVLPDSDFTLASIVSGAPYGATRIYQRRLTPGPARLPAVSVWDAAERRWLHDAVPVDGVAWTTGTGSLRISKGPQQWDQLVAGGVAAELPAAWYLLRVELAGDSRQSRVMTAAAGIAHHYPVGDLPPAMDVAPLLADEPLFLLQHHAGGVLGLNLVSADPGARVVRVETFRVSGFPDYRLDRERLAEQPLPALAQWTPDGPSGVTAAPDAAGLRVNGNASAWGYQLVSPRIEVVPGSSVTVRLPILVEAGRVCTGILDEQQQNWIVRPLDGAELHRFEAGANRAFVVVVSNCNGASGAAVASRFVVAEGRHAVFADRWYVETLMREFANAPR